MFSLNNLHLKKRLINQPMTLLLIMTLSCAFILTGCGSDSDSNSEIAETVISADTDTSTDTETEVTDADFVATDWTDETHSKNVDPNFDEVFSDTEVKRLDIVVTQARWQSMLDDMTALYGEFGRSSSNSLSDTDEDPIFVPTFLWL